MRTFVVSMCLLALGCLAQRPRPCRSPPLLTGALTVSTQNERLWAYAKYMYDALGQRIRLKEIGNFDNKTFTYDALLLYREGVMYQIDENKRRCSKQAIMGDFHPMAIPKNASLVGQVVLGSSSAPGQGLLVNSWSGSLPNKGSYITTVTEFGCIPVTTYYHSSDFGWVVTRYVHTDIRNLTGLRCHRVTLRPSKT
ncbi:ependymin-like 1 [Lampris incognitus]|uniref:ependymin-like 1 n=1 Tax=Lampris incognitus TaxID=2546036 RepID=UPI0024B56B1E|nr:ependymin-like 1 [Lampris incognitus]